MKSQAASQPEQPAKEAQAGEHVLKAIPVERSRGCALGSKQSKHMEMTERSCPSQAQVMQRRIGVDNRSIQSTALTRVPGAGSVASRASSQRGAGGVLTQVQLLREKAITKWSS